MNGSSNGSIPSIFDNLEACFHVCKGFSIEEKVTYVVTEKRVNDKTYYRPCESKYIKQFDTIYGYKQVPDWEIAQFDVKPAPKAFDSIEVFTQAYTIESALEEEGYFVDIENERCTMAGKTFYWECVSSSDTIDLNIYDLYEVED